MDQRDHRGWNGARLLSLYTRYKKLIEELSRRFPHLEPEWKEAMAETPWHVERLIFVKGPAG